MTSSIRTNIVEIFDNSTARDLLAFVRSSTHSNRYRMTYRRKALVTAYCLDLQKTFQTLEEKNAYLLSR